MAALDDCCGVLCFLFAPSAGMGAFIRQREASRSESMSPILSPRVAVGSVESSTTMADDKLTARVGAVELADDAHDRRIAALEAKVQEFASRRAASSGTGMGMAAATAAAT